MPPGRNTRIRRQEASKRAGRFTTYSEIMGGATDGLYSPAKWSALGERAASVLPVLLLEDGARAGTASYPSEASTSGCWKVPGLTVYRRDGGVLINSLVPFPSLLPTCVEIFSRHFYRPHAFASP